jgi:hypothetical protein
MKKLAILFLLLQTPLILAADKKPANPADFPLKLHITTSSLQVMPGGDNWTYIQLLETTVNGQPVQLRSFNSGVLSLGDYPARVSPQIHGAKGANTYDVYLGYDLLMPDGNTRTYTVTRLGPAVGTNP